ncbi:MAG: hopanoid-associated phosphorylase [Alphaproteobacteria bacterium]|nr:hopanoid-associated phosphorylase [Alphaproteobacteria bacterium]MBV9418659.1 hopanoid-associated phosphorylase [Alphaproteobacteria bacterium]MBV9903596.1 hopanoid-associated phosphorylase [Alphaproteobacteria bacterium]
MSGNVIAVTGLAREARIARRAKLTPVISGTDGELLTRRLEAAVAQGAKGIVSFGIAGALVPLLKIGDVVVATHVVHGDERYPTDAEWTRVIRAKLPSAVPGVIAGHDQIVSHVDGKRRLLSLTGAFAVDMESHIAARSAARHGIPFVAIRSISDAYNRGLPPAAQLPLKPSGRIQLRKVFASVANEPSQIPDLMRTGREAGRAFSALLRSRNALGLFLGCPYLG